MVIQLSNLFSYSVLDCMRRVMATAKHWVKDDHTPDLHQVETTVL